MSYAVQRNHIPDPPSHITRSQRGWLARYFLALTLVTLLASCSGPKAPPLDAALKEELKSFVMENHLIPEQYVLDKFLDHDIVFLGEWHYVRQNPILVRKLIPLLHQRGVNTLCLEFARRIDQPLIDSLLAGTSYDEQLARLITFRQYVHWGFQEYVDIYRSAWQLNQTLPPQGRRFRILGLNNSPDWSHIHADADRDNPDVMKAVWHGEDESDWARVILERVVARKEKALVYCGAHHAFTEYRQPIVNNGRFIRFGDVRVGNHVFAAIGKRAITVLLHAPWKSAEGYDSPWVRAGDGYIDAVLEELDPEYRRFGVDMNDTPFGRIPGSTAIYRHGYDAFTLATICDGYVCDGPLGSFEGVTPIRDFVTSANLAEARAQSPVPRFRNASPADFYDDAIRTANIRSQMPR
jgi:hypothetical protein